MSENEYQEKVDKYTKELPTLFTRFKEKSPDWDINHPSSDFVSDGIVREEKDLKLWFQQEYRPLFLLREAYGEENSVQEWDITAYIRSVVDGERKDRPSPTWRNVARWAYGILKMSDDGEFPAFPESSIITTKSDNHPLKQIAVVNIKKVNGKKTSKTNDLLRYAKATAAEIWKEIELIDPTVIISANDPLIQDELAKKNGFEINRQDKTSHLTINEHDVILIEYFHPADLRHSDLMNYCNLMAMYQRAWKAINK